MTFFYTFHSYSNDLKIILVSQSFNNNLGSYAPTIFLFLEHFQHSGASYIIYRRFRLEKQTGTWEKCFSCAYSTLLNFDFYYFYAKKNKTHYILVKNKNRLFISRFM